MFVSVYTLLLQPTRVAGDGLSFFLQTFHFRSYCCRCKDTPSSHLEYWELLGGISLDGWQRFCLKGCRNWPINYGTPPKIQHRRIPATESHLSLLTVSESVGY